MFIFCSNRWCRGMSWLIQRHTISDSLDNRRFQEHGARVAVKILFILTQYPGSPSREATTLLYEAQQTRSGDGSTGRDKQYDFPPSYLRQVPEILISGGMLCNKPTALMASLSARSQTVLFVI